MFSNSDELLKFIKDEGVEMVDVRFCDLPGVMQHFTVPVSSFDQSVFDDGLNFDGSSIRGFQAIHESDMSLFPDPTTAFIDPFRIAKTLVVNFFIHDPITGEPYSRDPRNIARKAMAYLATTGVGDTAYFAPEAEFYVFDKARFETKANIGYYEIDSIEGAWNTAAEDSRGYKTPYKGGYFPVSPTDHFGELRDEMVIELEKSGLLVERAHHEVGTAGQAEINYRFAELLQAADDVMKFKYIVKNTAWRNGRTATFMPKPIFGDNGSGMHVHQSIWNEGEPLFYDETGYGGLSDMARWYIGGILKHAPSLLAFTNPTVNSYHRLVPGFEAPISLVYSQRNRSACVRIPITGSNPKAKRIEFRCPDPSANPYLAFSALLLAGLDGIKNRMEPAAPDRQGHLRAPARRDGRHRPGPDLAQRRPRHPRGRPRVPHGRQRVHSRPDRELDRVQEDERDPARADASAPPRVRALLRHLVTGARRARTHRSSTRAPAMPGPSSHLRTRRPRRRAPERRPLPLGRTTTRPTCRGSSTPRLGGHLAVDRAVQALRPGQDRSRGGGAHRPRRAWPRRCLGLSPGVGSMRKPGRRSVSVTPPARDSCLGSAAPPSPASRFSEQCDREGQHLDPRALNRGWSGGTASATPRPDNVIRTVVTSPRFV